MDLSSLFRLPALLACVLIAAASALRAQSGTYVNFEAHQTRPACLSPDSKRLFVVNTPDGRLSVFDVSNPANPTPVLLREIAVGVEPVSVNAVSSDEAWVVNEVSDSVSVVSVVTGVVTDTLACKDEPADVVFAAGRAFVSCSRNNLIRVFDLATHAESTPIPLAGLNPRSLAVSNDGAKIYAAFALSGNRSTLLPVTLAPPPPAPTNTSLPPAPQVSLVVSADDARLNPKPNMLDNDVAEIDAATRTVTRYFHNVGTVNFAVAIRPGSTELWVANTEARNLVRFEPVLKGHSVDNRVTRIDTAIAGIITPFDLNPGIDYALFPNPAAQATALAQPTSIAFEPDGAFFWVASFGTDRVARINAATGAVTARIETGPTTGSAANPAAKRGTRGLVFHSANQRLYAVNRLSNTLTVVSTTSQQVVAEIPTGTFDPTPTVIRQGRGFLYDARLSGNGTQSCASCHIDGDRDELSWDLGDPGGSMQTVSQPNPLGGPPQTFSVHPMKGPMATQTLRGLAGLAPLHWRADRADFTAFNGSFVSLLGGVLLSTSDMALYRDFINTIVFEPNPNQNLDRTLPTTFPAGDPNAGNPTTGRNTFLNETYQPGLTCNTCHALPTGSNRLIIPGSALQESQDFKVPQLRNVYQKTFFVRSATTPSASGFGIGHDGTDPDLFTFLSRPVFGTFAADTTRKRNLTAFVMCLDNGTAPATGYARTVAAANVAASTTDFALLEAQATAGNVDFILRGIVNGERHGLRYRPATNDYVSDQTGLGPFTRTQLQAKISAASATLTLLGVPAGSGPRLSTDRDGNLVPDGDEPLPRLEIALNASAPQLAWPTANASLVLEYTDSLLTPNWQPVTEPRVPAGANVSVQDPSAPGQRFYRLRRP
jgi:YVTN family beta-propeller protein